MTVFFSLILLAVSSVVHAQDTAILESGPVKVFKAGAYIELANGSYGYLPTPKQHKSGGYETWLGTNRVEEESSTKIVPKLMSLFNTMSSPEIKK